MAITFVDSEVVNVTTAGTTITFTASNITGLADDDYMIFQVCHAEAEDGDWTGEPSGLTTLIAELQAGETPPSIPGLSVWAKFASSESGTYTFTTDFSSGMTGILSVYRGVDQTTPQDAAATTQQSTAAGNIDPNSITTVTDDAWVITMGFIDSTAITGVPTNYTTRGLGTTGAGGNGCSLECADDEITSFGSENPGTYTNTSEQWGCVTMALRPAAEGITAVTPSTFDIDNTDIDVDSVALFGATQASSNVYISAYPELADNGQMGEVDINAAVTVWEASQITLDLTDLSQATIDELNERILPQNSGLQLYIIVNVGGVPATTEYNFPVTMKRAQALEMALGAGTPGSTTERLTLANTFDGGRFEETAAQNPSTTTTNIGNNNNREDVWSMQLKPNARTTRLANYLDLPGTTDNSATIPDSATLDLTQTFWGSFEVELDDWTPTGGAVICSKWITSGNLRSFSFSVNSSGNLVMQYSTNGTAESTFTSASATGFTDGTKHWIRFLAVSNLTVFQVSEDGIRWSNLGANQGGETSIFNTSAAVELGAEDDGATGLWSGKFYQAILHEANGTHAMWVNFRNVAADTTSFGEGSHGATVTVNQNSSPQAEVVAGTESVIYQFREVVNGNPLETVTTRPFLNVSVGETIVCTLQTYALTGIAVNTEHGRVLPATLQTYALTGIATNLEHGRLLTADLQTYTLTGIATNLLHGQTLTADLQTYTLTGIDTPLVRTHQLVAALQTYVLTGIDVNTEWGHVLPATLQTYTLTGLAVTLTHGAGNPVIICDTQTYALTGIATNLLRGYVLPADLQTYILTGIDTPVDWGHGLIAWQQTYDYNPTSASYTMDSNTTHNSSGLFSSTRNGLGQSFTGDGGKIDRATARVQVVSPPAGDVYFEIYAHTGTFGTSSRPTGAVLATSEVIDSTAIPGPSQTNLSLNFPTPFQTVNGTKYCLALRFFEGSGSTFTVRNQNQTAPGVHAGNGFRSDNTTWTKTEHDDYYFVVRAAGESTGDANLLWGHLVFADLETYTLTGIDTELTLGFTLTADLQTYTLTGIATNLLYSRVLPADLQTYTLTGITTNLLHGQSITADLQTYTLTGIAVPTLWDHILPADLQTYILTGIDVALSKGGGNQLIVCETQTYDLTGVVTNTEWHRLLTATLQTYTLTGVAVITTKNIPLVATLQTYTLTGIATPTLWDRLLTATLQTYVLTGINVDLDRGKRLAADVQTYTLTGINVDLDRTYNLTADLQTYILTGIDVTLLAGEVLVADFQTYALTGIDVNLEHGYVLSADTQTYALTGIDVNTERGYVLPATLQTYALTGIATNLVWVHGLIADLQTYVLTGIDVNLITVGGATLEADTQTYALTGIATDLFVGHALVADLQTYTLTGIAVTPILTHVLGADTQAYILTGVDQTLRYGRFTTLDLQTYTLTGLAVTPIFGKGLIADLQTYVVTDLGSVGPEILADENFNTDPAEPPWVTVGNASAASGKLVVVVDDGGEDRKYLPISEQAEVWMSFIFKMELGFDLPSDVNVVQIGGVSDGIDHSPTGGIHGAVINDNGIYKWRFSWGTDASGVGLTFDSPTFVIGREYRINYYFKQATAESSNDGIAQAWVDGRLVLDEQTIDNFNVAPDTISIGVNLSSPGVSGILRFDDLLVGQTGHIPSSTNLLWSRIIVAGLQTYQIGNGNAMYSGGFNSDAIGNFASTPDSVPLSITGDIDIRIRLSMDNWQDTNQGFPTLVGKWGDVGGGNSFLLDAGVQAGFPAPGDTDVLRLLWSEDGTNVHNNNVISVPHGFVNHSVHWVRATLDIDNGAGGYDVNFYTSDDGALWTQLGPTQTFTTPTSIFDTTTVVSVSGRATGFFPIRGNIYRAQVLDGIDGTVELDIEFGEEAVGTTVFTESSSNAATVTINQVGTDPARIVDGDSNAKLTKNVPLVLTLQTYTLTGLATALRWDHVLIATLQTYVITAPVVDLYRSGPLGWRIRDEKVSGWTVAGETSNLWRSNGWMVLPGEAGNYGSSPASAPLSITGDIDMRTQVLMQDWTPEGNNYATLISRYSASDQCYGMQILPPLDPGGQGHLKIYWSTTGIDFFQLVSTVPMGVPDGKKKWIRATLDVDNGAGGRDANFYTSDDGIVWIKMGDTVTEAGVTSIFASPTAELEIGTIFNGTLQFWAGNFYRAQLYDGIDGTLVLDADFRKPRIDDLSFLEDSSNEALVTINQSGSNPAYIRSEQPQNPTNVWTEVT